MTAISLSCWSESDQKAIREQLVRILNSGPFHQAQRRQRFLEYIVNEAMAGRGERLKGYDRLYETKVTDGERAAYGRGASREASEQAALRNWNAKSRDLDTREPE